MNRQLRSLIFDFMKRNHIDDSRRLNQILSSSNDAGLVHKMPPIPFTGNIESMEKGNCVCLLGINPLWPAPGKKAHDMELKPAINMIKKITPTNNTSSKTPN